MGMFDTVNVPCPNCGKGNEIQSKAGACNLDDYSMRDAPASILADIEGDHACEKCGLPFRVAVVAIASVYRLETLGKGPPRGLGGLR